MNCEICDKVIKKTQTFKCYHCSDAVCDKCILKNVCSDCGVNLCKDCYENKSGENICGCYGNCYFCGKNVDRGNDGWPCYKCKKWYCNDCKQTYDFNKLNKCTKCKIEEDNY